jgi:hypothetical protein
MDINCKQVKRLPLIQIKDIAREVRPKSGLGYIFMSGTREIMNVRFRGIHLIISIVIRPEKINIFKHHKASTAASIRHQRTLQSASFHQKESSLLNSSTRILPIANYLQNDPFKTMSCPSNLSLHNKLHPNTRH